MSNVRPCSDDDRTAILAIINAAAEAYRGVIPADRWHEPYMPRDELDSEIAAGVAFWGVESDGLLVGVMGFQPVRDVDLIRHAYVLPASQRRGLGGELLGHLRRLSSRRMLVGTWMPQNGRSASISATASIWSRRSKRPCSSSPIGAFQNDKSRPR